MELYNKLKKEHFFIFLILLVSLILFQYFDFGYTSLAVKDTCYNKGYSCCDVNEGKGDYYFSLDNTCSNDQQCWDSCEIKISRNLITGNVAFIDFFTDFFKQIKGLFKREVVGAPEDCECNTNNDCEGSNEVCVSAICQSNGFTYGKCELSDNNSPTANAGQDKTVNIGETVTLDGSDSSDSDGSISSYSWNFGDNSQGIGASTTHSYSSAGIYTSTLTVTDNEGATGTDTATVNVQPTSVECVYNQNSILKKSSVANAHAALISSDTSYTYDVCTSTDVQVDTACNLESVEFARLSSPDNAHVEEPGQVGNYPNALCLKVANEGDIERYYGSSDNCDEEGATCLFSISDQTNAHIGECGYYDINVCYKIILDPVPSFNIKIDNVVIDPIVGGTIDDVFTFDATGSYDLEEDPLIFRWAWDWDGSNYNTDYSQNAIIDHIYTTSGTTPKIVRLQVKEDITGGKTASTQINLVVNEGEGGNQPPSHYSGITKLEAGDPEPGDTIILMCDFTDAEDNDEDLDVKVWLGTCASDDPSDCYSTRDWTDGLENVQMNWDSYSETFRLSFTVPGGWNGKVTAGTCRATDTGGLVSDGGSIDDSETWNANQYPFFDVLSVPGCENDPGCNNVGDKKCSGNIVQTCGNYDADNCLEWGGDQACSALTVCSNGVCIDSCGNNNLDYSEDCDGTLADGDWGGITGCGDLQGYESGTLSCTSNCEFDTSGCTLTCDLNGDGQVNVVDLGVFWDNNPSINVADLGTWWDTCTGGS